MSQIEHCLPVTSDVIQRESRRDNVLARVHDHVTMVVKTQIRMKCLNHYTVLEKK